MKVIQSGGIYQIYGDELIVLDQIPLGVYDVCFDKFKGFFFSPHGDLIVNEDKVYGVTQDKVDKVLRSFNRVNRNFGVILSGRKGAGKSLFARMLSVKAKEYNLPVLLVSSYIPGVASFLSTIEQEVIVLFDEFEKTFYSNNSSAPQEELLPLFDGIDSGKKLFVITCNEVRKLNSCLINRPGRFHYHFVMDNPSIKEVREYMTDKLYEQYHHMIDKIVRFSMSTNLTYDVLRAIAFELNGGNSLRETLEDLNICKEQEPNYIVRVKFAGGGYAENCGVSIDLTAQEDTPVWLDAYNKDKEDIGGFYLEFDPRELIFDQMKAQFVLPVQCARRDVDKDDFNLSKDEQKANYEYLNKVEFESVVITRVIPASRKYTV